MYDSLTALKYDCSPKYSYLFLFLRSKGIILNISSASGMYPLPLLTVYSSTKVCVASGLVCHLSIIMYLFVSSSQHTYLEVVITEQHFPRWRVKTDHLSSFSVCRPLWISSLVAFRRSTGVRASSFRWVWGLFDGKVFDCKDTQGCCRPPAQTLRDNSTHHNTECDWAILLWCVLFSICSQSLGPLCTDSCADICL